MGQVTTSTASGQGSLSLSGQHTVNEVAAMMITPADLISIDGASPVRRIHHQAWFGLGFTPEAGPLAGVPVIMWHRYLELEAQDYQLSPVIFMADTLYYDVQPGGVMFFEVDW